MKPFYKFFLPLSTFISSFIIRSSKTMSEYKDVESFALSEQNLAKPNSDTSQLDHLCNSSRIQEDNPREHFVPVRVSRATYNPFFYYRPKELYENACERTHLSLLQQGILVRQNMVSSLLVIIQPLT